MNWVLNARSNPTKCEHDATVDNFQAFAVFQVSRLLDERE